MRKHKFGHLIALTAVTATCYSHTHTRSNNAHCVQVVKNIHLVHSPISNADAVEKIQ